MAPLPQNNTARTWTEYTDGVNEHTLMVRFDATELAVADALGYVADFFDAIASDLFEITVLGARWMEQGGDVSIPVTWPGDSVYGSSTMPLVAAPKELRWVGRDSSGRKATFSIYGCDLAVPDTYRIISVGDNLPNRGVLAINAGSAAGAFLTIGGNRPTMKNYVNVNHNSYWETQARG